MRWIRGRQKGALHAPQGVRAKVRELVGVNMGWLTREGCHLGLRAKIPDKHRHTARVCRRFFTALVLADVVDEVSRLFLSSKKDQSQDCHTLGMLWTIMTNACYALHAAMS